MIDIAPLSAADPSAIEALLDAAFGSDRHTRTSYRLREGTVVLDALSFAAFADGQLVGTIQCSPVALTDGAGRATPLVLVGPVAVLPGRQRDGVGRQLMARMLEAADNGQALPGEAAAALVLIGDPEYYGRFFGFVADATGSWRLPGPVERRRLLARVRPGTVLPAEAALGPRVTASVG